MKRFYKDVAVREHGGAFEVTLDAKPIKTPMKATPALRTRALAEAVAQEWREQGADIAPATMPLTRLANTSIDRSAAQRDLVIAEVLNFAGGDLLCYRAEDETLAERQREAWDPILDWLAEKHGARLSVTIGVTHILQPADAILALGEIVRGLDAYALTSLHAATTITGSLVLALAVIEGRLGVPDAFALSQLDEIHQAEKWGEDAAAAERARGLAHELKVAAEFELLSRS
jgi:chaperone required for assembly of F1-ATPase